MALSYDALFLFYSFSFEHGSRGFQVGGWKLYIQLLFTQSSAFADVAVLILFKCVLIFHNNVNVWLILAGLQELLIFLNGKVY